jgi:(p)ppGpp synthase/HD superfamily hydrolase
MTDPVAAARAFAARRHDGQRRKDARGSPYIIHLAEVATLVTAFGGDETARVAAWLHDTVEDCPPTRVDEIAALFGAEIAGVVDELTDDKALPKAERKRAQVAHAPGRSAAAALVKLCDKASNCAAVGFTPAVGWDAARRLAYLNWSEQVAAALPEGHAAARAHLAGVIAVSRERVAMGVA